MANRNTNTTYKKCKIDFVHGLVVEYGKDSILEHRLSDVFSEYSNDSDTRYCDIVVKENYEIIPSEESSLSDEE